MYLLFFSSVYYNNIHTFNSSPCQGMSASVLTVKFLNFQTQENLAVINLKFKQMPNLRVFHLKDAYGKANSEDPDQTAPRGAV